MQKNMSPADLHTPEELLAGATALLANTDPQVTRAAVLEAITALEAFVHQTVFAVLKNRLDPLLTTWLEERTRMDFDSRLSVLTPVALGQPIDKQSVLWSRYKKAKELRNDVTHSGRKVSSAEAREVVDTVYAWLAYLGSTAEVDLALLGFKRQVEQGSIYVPSEQVAIRAVADYFGRSKAATADIQPVLTGNLRADAILKFGVHTVIVEAKFVNSRDIQRVVEAGIKQVLSELPSDPSYRAAVVLFNRAGIPEGYPALSVHGDGRVSILLVSLLPSAAE